MVYGLGTNDNGRLGFQDTDNDIPYRTLYPEKIQILSGKYIKKFLHCSKMCNAALMGNGQVNFWGTSIFHAYKTPFKLDGLNEKVIINIACSARYFLFLDENGTVYVWGEHSYVAREKASHITNDYIYIRKSFEIISEALNGKKVVHIACGSNFSVVITDENKLYSWGDNEYGQLGDVEYALHKNDSYCTFSYTPLEIITLSNKDIVKVVCGKAHTLALSKDGKLFTWGRNNYGQLGVEKKNFRRLNLLPMKTILDIAAVYTSDISVALAEDECVYIWGCCFNMKITTPIVTTFSTIYDVFTNNVPHMVYIYDRVIAHESKHSKRIEMDTMWKSLETAFDDPTTSDLVVNVENKPIYVHKIILMKRSEYFKNLLHNEYMEEEKNLRVNIQHFEFSYVVYKAFLEYLYTEMIKLSTVENILESGGLLLPVHIEAYDSCSIKRIFYKFK